MFENLLSHCRALFMPSSHYRNLVGLSERLEPLLKAMASFELEGNLRQRLLVYLLDGTEESALEDLAALEDAAARLHLACSSQYSSVIGQPVWPDFLKVIEPVDCRFYLRLGKMFEAAARRLPADRFFCEFWFDNALWLEILLQEATLTYARVWSNRERTCALDSRLIEEMLRASGKNPHTVLQAPFRADAKRWENKQMQEMVLRVAGIGKAFAEHRDLIAPHLAEGSAASRLQAVENLSRAAAPPEAFAAELVAAATDSSKLLREAAETLLKKIPEVACPLLSAQARDGDRTQREHAVRVLGRLGGSDIQIVLGDLRQNEKSPAVRKAIDTALSDAAATTMQPEEAEVLPPHEPVELHAPITAGLRTALQKIFDAYNLFAAEHNERLANPQPKQHVHPNRPLQSIDETTADHVCRLLWHGGSLRGCLTDTLTVSRAFVVDKSKAALAFVQHPDCKLIQVVRLLAMQNLLQSPSQYSSGFEWGAANFVARYRDTHDPKITLLDLAEALQSLSIPDGIILQEVLYGYGILLWDWEATWPYFMNRLEDLERAFEPPPAGNWQGRWKQERARNNAYRILAGFRRVPPTLVGRLWELAIGTTKSDRQRAQPICQKLPDVHERLVSSLASGNFQTRLVAAEWLGRLGDKRAVEPLKAAAKKEKQDAALDEMLTALERLGESIETFLDRKKLQTDAVKNLAKGIPNDLSWFPLASLPTVHWNDNGQPVPTETITWLVVQSYKLKSPEAGALLRRYCEMLRPAEREQLGNFALAAWLERDLNRKYTDAEARQKAQKEAPHAWQQWQVSINWYRNNNHALPASIPQSLQQTEEKLFQQFQREAGSAAGEKGVLAIASACCGDAAVGPVQKYLKDWYGMRASQCKALIAMLAGVDRPLAIQYLLSISNRFRTKGIREEAEKYVQILAERKGWTLDELADRTMPTCGLDDEGKLELNFGPRAFVARVNGDLEFLLADAEGKALKKLPDPRKEDDAELAQAAKKAFSAAKSELKKFAGLTATRFYEAMCTQRTWPVVDWKTYLLGHPLARILCQRLVWAALDADTLKATFRPLDDGTLTDLEDSDVALSDSWKIRIAHSCNVSTETAQAWARHLADYSVMPLFAQFARPAFDLTETRQNDTVLSDFEGHLVEAFKLRGLATKLGYTRGQAEDGGWFYSYLKPFPGLGLEVHLEFSGNGLPEENRTVALTRLTFERKDDQQQSQFRQSDGVPLKDIPRVLLSECIGDLRAIAATGSGFDPDWEKNVHG
jgi:HEAT repeat protein